MKKPKVLFVSQEIMPFLEVTEISKVARLLPQGIQESGKEIRTFMPRFGVINERRNQLHEVIRLSGMNLIIDDTDHPLIIKVASIQSARMQVYFIDNEEYFQRKMVFHAWINPYRAEFNLKEDAVSSTHITKLHPEWFVTYGDKKYFDPGNPDAQQYVVDVITDVVKRYAVDAIHFDDFFYPYPVEGKKFPDDSTYQLYGKGMTRDDWRRSNTDSIIAHLYVAIKKENDSCLFGISPFGVWRNADKDPVNGSKTNGSLSNYDELYADILLWLKNGWIDYVAPQLYWEFNHRQAPFKTLLEWWGQHTYGKHCYIGLGIYKAGSNAAWRDKKLLPLQIEAIRNTPNIQGMAFFSSKSFESNPNGWSDSLRLNYFKQKANVPEIK